MINRSKFRLPVVMSAGRYERLCEQIEDLRDRLSVHEREGRTVSAEQLADELEALKIGAAGASHATSPLDLGDGGGAVARTGRDS